MKAFKGATASVKESVQNVVAKKDELVALNKAAAQAKAETKAAENKAGKHDVQANYHNKQAEILREYEQKKADNKAVKEEKKATLHQKKADEHANKKGAVGDDEQTTFTPAATSDTSEPAGPTEDALDGRDTSPPSASDVQEPASEARDDMTGTNPDTAAADSSAVPHSQVPMHGSGVPTHSDLHTKSGDKNDVRTTQTMEGSPNTGSYM